MLGGINALKEMKQEKYPLISVIVPVYNVEKYIRRCVDSILSQTYKNLEILLVDDGSNDLSGEICDEYAGTDKRVRAFHKKNGGLASARNFGLENVMGEYVSFVDSDDWIEKNTYSYCLDLINNENCKVDVVQFGISCVEDEKEQPKVRKEKITRHENKDILNFLMIQSTKTDSYFSVCRCLFSRNILQDERFPLGRINEDIVFKYQVFAKANMMIDSNCIKYYYFQNTGSITTDGLKKKDFDLYTAASELKALTDKEDYGEIKKMGEVKYARTSFSLLCKIAYFGVSDESIDKADVVKKLQTELRKNFKLLIKAPMAFSRKICLLLLVIDFRLLEVPVKLYRKAKHK